MISVVHGVSSTQRRLPLQCAEGGSGRADPAGLDPGGCCIDLRVEEGASPWPEGMTSGALQPLLHVPGVAAGASSALPTCPGGTPSSRRLPQPEGGAAAAEDGEQAAGGQTVQALNAPGHLGRKRGSTGGVRDAPRQQACGDAATRGAARRGDLSEEATSHPHQQLSIAARRPKICSTCSCFGMSESICESRPCKPSPPPLDDAEDASAW